MVKKSLVLLAAAIELATAFSPSSVQVQRSSTISSTKLNFGIPTFGAGKDKEEKKNEDNVAADKPKIGLSGLIQVITAGMGAPFLGEFEGVDEETGKMMFSLEANNLVDEKGNSKQTSMPYFESGWVDEKDLEKERERKEKGGGFKFW
mmetsp:Transcript_6156/g.7803  ORF Transcript_6156/g.7803 Transcript_6156/m.7803 type:complete len:148 (-) Transcript_6156:100-543(-)